jgi:uncharacterized protein (TIGR03083 family)
MAALTERVKLLQTETERIKRYLHALPPEAWERQSACDQWQVREVVAHLAGGAEFYRLYRNAGSTCSPKRRIDAMILSWDR